MLKGTFSENTFLYMIHNLRYYDGTPQDYLSNSIRVAIPYMHQNRLTVIE